jgi:ribonuclease H2 subunit C
MDMEQATLPAAAAAGVTATVDLSPASTDLGGVHLLPCGIRQNGAVAVSDYFKPRGTGTRVSWRPPHLEDLVSLRSSVWVIDGGDAGVEVDGVKIEEAFFRGRKLQGATLALSDGYRGKTWLTATSIWKLRGWKS